MDINRIEDEISAIQAIYHDTFEREKPKAWQGAASPPAFTIIVSPDEPAELASNVSVKLHVKYCNTYPRAPALFAIQQPTLGLTPDHISKLTKYLREESLRLSGSEMVLEIRTICADWIAQHNTIVEGSSGNKGKGKRSKHEKEGPSISLAAQMTERAKLEEENQQQKAQEEADRNRHMEEERASLLSRMIQEEAAKRLENEKRLKVQIRERHLPQGSPLSDNTPLDASDGVVTFEDGVELPDGVKFETIRVSNRRKDLLGHIYSVEPVYEGPPISHFFELYVIDFTSSYYVTSQGKKRLYDLTNDIRRIIRLQHDNLLNVYAVKLDFTFEFPRLSILEERRPNLCMKELLLNCDGLRSEKVKDYLGQILAALEYLHAHELIHKGIAPASIWLCTIEDPKFGTVTRIKLHRPSYQTRTLDLYKSNTFGVRPEDEVHLPDPWISPEVLESPHQYSQRRDIWSLGVTSIQMLMGLGSFVVYQDPIEAMDSCDAPESLRSLILTMFEPNKKRVHSCSKLLDKLSKVDLNETTVIKQMASGSAGADLPTPMPGPRSGYNGSPETSFFAGPVGQSMLASVKHLSRFREDWEELEFLGKGGFGSVVKARNKLDGRIYAVKKIRLRPENNSKILREVNTLSRLSHSYIVRYYTTWLETTAVPSKSRDDSETDSNSTPSSPAATIGPLGADEEDEDNLFAFDDLSLVGPSLSQSSSRSFPSIHFGGSDSNPHSNDGDSSDSSSESSSGETTGPGVQLNVVQAKRRGGAASPAPQILYIQMEFVERQTLKEAIEEGLSESEAWRLFRQILDALVHISSLGIIHRDIKLTNIFIDAKGDVKVGDFGLATSSLAAVDPSDVSTRGSMLANPEITSGVGTGLYIAPEVLSSRPGTRDHTKADMYSLGIVFFEMNWPPFQTDTERYHVLQKLRQTSIVFPEGWQDRPRQKEVIQSLLQHNPAKRPSALELSTSKLLPERIEEESIKEALRLMVDPQSPRYEALLRALFSQSLNPAKAFSYDIYAEHADYASLNSIVRDHIIALLRTHGAIETDPPLLVPVTDLYSAESSQQQPPTFLDRQGELVALPKNIVVPLARFAARAGLRRIKRYYVGHAYEPTAGQPKAWAQAALDIISPDTADCAAEAELIGVTNDVICMFPGVSSQPYDIHISDTRLLDAVLAGVPLSLTKEVISILEQTKSSFPQKRALLTKLGLARPIIDDLEALMDTDDVETAIGRAPSNAALFTQLQQTIRYSRMMGVKRRFLFRPLLMRHQPHFGGGIVFEFRGAKRADVVARGGRYDQLIRRFTRPSTTSKKPLSIKATAVQIALEKITSSLAAHQSISVDLLLKARRSFGLWSPRRCDVYIVSFQKGSLGERIELANTLWSNGISADLMYDEATTGGGVAEGEGWESHTAVCEREGILFLVWYRLKSATYKVKSVLKGTENEIRPGDLVAWLQHQIAEQKRVDLALGGGTGAPAATVATSGIIGDHGSSVSGGSIGGIQVIVAGGERGEQRKTQRHKLKTAFHEKAHLLESDLKSALQSNQCPTIAVDLPSTVLSTLANANPAWVTNDDTWKTITNEQKDNALQGLLLQVREVVSRKKLEGAKWTLLISVKDERVYVLKL